MKQQILASSVTFALVLASGAIANAEEIRAYEHSGFDIVEVHEGLDVTIIRGDDFSIEATSNKSSHLDKLEITQQGERLIIGQKNDWGIGGLLSLKDSWNKKLHIKVYMPTLTEAEANSGADLRVAGFTSQSLSLSANSGADMIAKDLSAKALFIDASGGASITAEGKCESLDAEASSGSDIWATQMECNTGKIEASSGGDIDVTITNHLTAEAVAGGTIKVRGQPKTTKIEAFAGGDVVIAR